MVLAFREEVALRQRAVPAHQRRAEQLVAGVAHSLPDHRSIDGMGGRSDAGFPRLRRDIIHGTATGGRMRAGICGPTSFAQARGTIEPVRLRLRSIRLQDFLGYDLVTLLAIDHAHAIAVCPVGFRIDLLVVPRLNVFRRDLPGCGMRAGIGKAADAVSIIVIAVLLRHARIFASFGIDAAVADGAIRFDDLASRNRMRRRSDVGITFAICVHDRVLLIFRMRTRAGRAAVHAGAVIKVVGADALHQRRFHCIRPAFAAFPTVMPHAGIADLLMGLVVNPDKLDVFKLQVIFDMIVRAGIDRFAIDTYTLVKLMQFHARRQRRFGLVLPVSATLRAIIAPAQVAGSLMGFGIQRRIGRHIQIIVNIRMLMRTGIFISAVEALIPGRVIMLLVPRAELRFRLALLAVTAVRAIETLIGVALYRVLLRVVLLIGFITQEGLRLHVCMLARIDMLAHPTDAILIPVGVRRTRLRLRFRNDPLFSTIRAVTICIQIPCHSVIHVVHGRIDRIPVGIILVEIGMRAGSRISRRIQSQLRLRKRVRFQRPVCVNRFVRIGFTGFLRLCGFLGRCGFLRLCRFFGRCGFLRLCGFFGRCGFLRRRFGFRRLGRLGFRRFCGFFRRCFGFRRFFRRRSNHRFGDHFILHWSRLCKRHAGQKHNHRQDCRHQAFDRFPHRLSPSPSVPPLYIAQGLVESCALDGSACKQRNECLQATARSPFLLPHPEKPARAHNMSIVTVFDFTLLPLASVITQYSCRPARDAFIATE